MRPLRPAARDGLDSKMLVGTAALNLWVRRVGKFRWDWEGIDFRYHEDGHGKLVFCSVSPMAWTDRSCSPGCPLIIRLLLLIVMTICASVAVGSCIALQIAVATAVFHITQNSLNVLLNILKVVHRKGSILRRRPQALSIFRASNIVAHGNSNRNVVRKTFVGCTSKKARMKAQKILLWIELEHSTADGTE